MSEALDRLSEMVRQAEAKTRSQRIHIEIRTASEQLRSATERARIADQRLREVRPARLHELEQLDLQEHQLKDLVKKVAQMKTSLEAAESPEDLIVSAHRDIEARRRSARAELDEVMAEAEESKRELRPAMEQYKQLRIDLDRLQPQLASSLAEEDQIVREAALFFPAGQLQALAVEVDEGVSQYGQLDSREQYAQLKIWIGRYRRLQTFPLTEEEQAMSRRIFSKLVGLSKEYEPGYIEAFQINFSCDWDKFIEEATDQLKQATESLRRKRESNRFGDEGSAAGNDARSYDAFSHASRASDDLDPMRDDEDSDDRFADLLSLTRGMRVLLVGGVARDSSRMLIEHAFRFDRLDWEEYEYAEPDVQRALEQRVLNRNIDLVLVLRNSPRRPAPERLRAACDQAGVPCLVVENGDGPEQIGEALRRGLSKAVQKS